MRSAIYMFGLTLSLISLPISPLHVACQGAQPFNVVFIVIDDLGWSDLGCTGSDFYETPHVDQLARESLHFTTAYAAAPVCSPTRAALLTGKVPARLDMTIWHEGAASGGPTDRKLLQAECTPNLPREEVTLAELFRAARYRTFHIGKWHLGNAPYYPETQGFDVNIGGTFWGAPATFFHPFRGKWNSRDPETRYVPNLGLTEPGDYLPDRLTDAALDAIDRAGDQPFFLNMWYYTVHSPYEAPRDLIARNEQKPPGRFHRQPTYAAMVSRMDANVGRLLDRLDERGLADRTIVIFTSDNGGVDFETRSIVPTSNLPLRSGKGTLYEGGIRVPLLVRWPGKTVPGTNCTSLVSSQDFLPTFVEYLRQADQPAEMPADIDGISLLPLMSEPGAVLDRQRLHWHYPHYYPRMTPASAIRQGNWKLIHYYEDDRMELYDLSQDRGEQHDLASTLPDVRDQLRQGLDRWRADVGANPPRRHN